MARVFLAEDHPAVRHGLRLVLGQAGHDLCGEGETIAEALRAIQATRPDLVLVDLSLGEEDGLDLLRKASRLKPGIRLLVYSMFEDITHVHLALEAGASGYLTKREPVGLLAVAVQACLEGRTYLSPRVEGKWAAWEGEAQLLATLSPTERLVLDQMGQGRATPAIAEELQVSPRTVETYYARIIAKLGLEGMKDLRRRAASLQV